MTTDNMKQEALQDVTISVLLHACTFWTLTKYLKKKLDVNFARMLLVVLNKSWKKYP